MMGPDGADEGIGPNVVKSHVPIARDREEGSARVSSLRRDSPASTNSSEACHFAMNSFGVKVELSACREGSAGRPLNFTARRGHVQRPLPTRTSGPPR